MGAGRGWVGEVGGTWQRSQGPGDRQPHREEWGMGNSMWKLSQHAGPASS